MRYWIIGLTFYVLYAIVMYWAYKHGGFQEINQ